MTVKEVFDLRKQGRIEEAYEAIRPMYAQHKGRYTTLCMFWTAADVFKLRLDQKRYEEAEKILEALKRMLPRVEEINRQLEREHPTAPKPETKLPWEKTDTQQEGSSASAFIASATRRLAKAQKTEKKSSPARATDHSRGGNPTVPKPTTHAEPRRGDTTPENLSHPDNPCPTEFPTNSQLLHDYPGHLIVSLDDGIIRPIDGINAPQRVVLDCIKAHPGLKVPGIEAETGIPAKSVERHIKVLIERNLIEHRGSKKTGGYYVVTNE